MAIFGKSDNVDKKFKNLDISSEVIEGVSFKNCTFNESKFSEASFTNCGFTNCALINCDLSLVKLHQTHFRDSFFDHCRMLGINWCQADWESRSLLSKKHVDFEKCLLDHSLFIGLDLTKTKFIDCKARQMDFEGANLSQVDFSGADLEGTRFINCDLSQANFTNAVNYTINAGYNKLHKTRFSLPEAIALLHSLDIILEERD